MSHARHDTDALARFLTTIRPDWNLGTVVTHLAREHPTEEQWPGLALTAVTLALVDPDATPLELHAHASWPGAVTQPAQVA